MVKLIAGCLIVFFINPFTLLAQNDFEPSNSLRVEIGLPATLELATNSGFRDLMTGLVNAAVFYQLPVFNSFTFGAGIKYTLFNVNEFKNTIDLSGNLHLAGAFAKIGREKYYGSLGVDYGIKVGHSFNFSATNYCKEANGKARLSQSLFVEPNFTLSYVVDEKNAWTLFNLSYAFYDFVFNPNFVCVTNFPGINADRIRARTSFLTFGFGYTHYF